MIANVVAGPAWRLNPGMCRARDPGCVRVRTAGAAAIRHGQRPVFEGPATLRSRTVAHYAGSYEVPSSEARHTVTNLLTRQAVKRLMQYLSELNGGMHCFLDQYLAAHPITAATDGDAWLAELAASPTAMVRDMRRPAQVVSIASLAIATLGEQEVSPRDVCERILMLREAVTAEMALEMGKLEADDAQVANVCPAPARVMSDAMLPRL